MNYNKHLILINKTQYDLGDGIDLEYDLSNIFINASFSFPFIQQGNIDTTRIKKYDEVSIYFKTFSNSAEAENATRNEMNLIFRGYVDSNPLQLSKTSGYQYKLNCKSMLGITFERPSLINYSNDTIVRFLEQAIDNSNLGELISDIDIFGLPSDFNIKIDSENKFGETLMQLKDKYALHIFESPDNRLVIQTPFYLSQVSTNAWSFDVEDNVIDIDFGDLSTKVDCIICVGRNRVGVAYDPIAFQLKYGVLPENIVSNPNIDRSKLNIRYIYRRDLASQTDCQEVARNKLVDLAKNNTISFTANYDPRFKVGDTFIVRNSLKIPPSQVFIIKNITVNISKSSLSCSITGYANSIIDFPEDLLLSNTGLLNTNILQNTAKIEQSLNLR